MRCWIDAVSTLKNFDGHLLGLPFLMGLLLFKCSLQTCENVNALWRKKYS